MCPITFSKNKATALSKVGDSLTKKVEMEKELRRQKPTSISFLYLPIKEALI